MTGDLKAITKAVKLDSIHLAASSASLRNQALLNIKEALWENRQQIFNENLKDLSEGEKNNLSDLLLKRLKFDEAKLQTVLSGIDDLIALPDPLHRSVMKRQLDDGLLLERTTCPIGVIGVIFESRPDALVQIASLCLKSGNAVFMKGGSETVSSNRILSKVIKDAAIKSGVDPCFLTLLENREEIRDLLACDDSIDLIIPRGSNEFVSYIMNNTKIPVMGHAAGVCHVYVDKAASLDLALPVVIDSKLQYVVVCNTAETLLVHEDVAAAFLPVLSEKTQNQCLELRGDSRTRELIDCTQACDSDFGTEFGDRILAVKVVDSLEEAIQHINRYGSHHTDAIITEDQNTAEQFLALVDSASVMHNCSTRFADGYRYGFGAEVGISTGKLHARGPVGLDGLTTYKYLIRGSGQIVADYAEGRKAFKFKDV
jgi:glutamate-5-semialdehyde dehydrogenase